MKYKKMKAKALSKFKENYALIIVAFLIYMFVEGLFDGTSKLIYNNYMNVFFNIIITGLLYEGLMQIIIKVARGKKTNIMDLFNKTDLFWKTAAVTIILTVVTLICGFMEFITGKSLSMFVIYQSNLSTLVSAFMILFGILLCLGIFAFYSMLMISFSQVYYILYENEKMPVFEIFERSMDLTDNHKFDFIVYNLDYLIYSLIGMIIWPIVLYFNSVQGVLFGVVLSLAVLFIVMPCMMIANVYFYDELKKMKKNKS